MRDASEAQADAALTVRENAPKPAEGRFTGGSAYRNSFRQGATLVPRMLRLVERKSLGRLGEDPTAPFVVQPPQQPGKEALEVAGPAWSTGSRPNFCTRCCWVKASCPIASGGPFEGVVPVTAQGAVLDLEAAANRGYSGLHGWMTAAEGIWNAHRP